MQISEHIGALTVANFCKTFGIGKSLLYSEIRAGRITARRARGRTLILKNEADRWARTLPAIKPRAVA